MANHESESRADEDAELKVTDRRLFTADGQLRGEAVTLEREEEPRVPTSTTVDRAWSPPEAGGEFERRPIEEPAGVDFSMVVNSMAELALLFLGEIPHPSTGEPAVDLRRARIQIDMLDLLRVKTRGNLAPEEEHLLERVLYELRMRYLHRSNQP